MTDSSLKPVTETRHCERLVTAPEGRPGMLKGGVQYVSMLAGLSMFALICLAWLPCALVLRWLLPVAWGRKLGRRVPMFGFHAYLVFLETFCGFRFDLAALDALRHEGALILVANHPSLLDAVMIISRIPNASCIMKAALFDNPLYGAAARLAGYIRNDDPLEMSLAARKELELGSQLILFPEGSRTVDFPMDHCSSSAGLIARASGVPVQSLIIECSVPYLGKHWPLFRPAPLPMCFSLRLGQRFNAPDDVKTFTAQLEQHFRDELDSSDGAKSGCPN